MCVHPKYNVTIGNNVSIHSHQTAQHASHPINMAFVLWFFCLVALLATTQLGCGSASLQQARSAEKRGELDKALEMYGKLARDPGNPKAIDAQYAVVSLLVNKERWREVLSESSRLASFFDPEDDWYKNHRARTAIWNPARQKVERLLTVSAEKALKQARHHGNPTTYIAGGHLYGLYIEHYPKGKKRYKAAMGRAFVMSIRSQCFLALKWFGRSVEWVKESPLTKQQTFAFTQDAKRGTLGCRIKLWRRAQQEPITDKKQIKPRQRAKREGFQKLTKEAEELLKHPNVENLKVALQGALALQRDSHYAEALTFYLMIVRFGSHHPISALAKRSALQLFGRTSRWDLMLPQLMGYLRRTKGRPPTRFTKRLRILIVLHGLRQARPLLAQKKYKEAAKRFLAVHAMAPNDMRVLSSLYDLGQRLEKYKQNKTAAGVYRKMFEGQTKHKLTTRAMYRYAIVLHRLKRPLQAAKWLLTLANQHPKSIIASRALYMSYLLYKKNRYFRRARRLRRMLRKRYPRAMEMICLYNKKARATPTCQTID